MSYKLPFKATDFKFGRHVPWGSPHMTLKILFEKGAWLGSSNPRNLEFNAQNFRGHMTPVTPISTNF